MWLAKQNYYVFKNIDNNSPIDVVAIKDNEIILIDVKSTRINKNSGNESKSRSLTLKQKDLGVRLLYVYENGDCKFGD
tara:strand:- start:1234 stop:1467 length:234 start_codon:yes stop_codon:yes gene_type:complete